MEGLNRRLSLTEMRENDTIPVPIAVVPLAAPDPVMAYRLVSGGQPPDTPFAAQSRYCGLTYFWWTRDKAV